MTTCIFIFLFSVSFSVSLSTGIIDIGDPVSIINSFFVLLNSTVVVKFLFLSTGHNYSFNSLYGRFCIVAFDANRCVFSVGYIPYFAFVIFFLSACPWKLAQLLHVWSSAGHLCAGFQFGMSQNIHGLLLLTMFLGGVLNLSILVHISPYWFFFNFNFRFDINASGIVFLLFFFSYVFCLIISTVFFILSIFSFINLPWSFLPVIAVINFDMSSSSVVMFSKLHSFNLYQFLINFPGVSGLISLVQKNSPRLWYVLLFGKNVRW